ncbi:MAG: DedA family protein [Patescibacteria group bacterium]|nr:DedA family protein [Patescibacteria group bacterium]
MLISLVHALLQFAQDIGYWGVVFLMTIESSFIPFPSEIVIPPAAYLAAQGKLNIYLVIGSGILGSLMGALINYFLAYYLGRPLVYRLAKTKWAKILLVKTAQIERAEELFNDYRRGSTFFGRLIPVIRQLISLPAGFAKMPLAQFIFYTFLGSGLWTLVLAALGYFFGANETLWKTYYSEISWGILVVALIFVFYFIYRRREK